MAEGGGPEPGEQERLSSGPAPPSARDLQVRRALRAGARRRETARARGLSEAVSGLDRAFPEWQLGTEL